MVIPFSNKLFLIRASLVAQQETKLRSLDLEDLLEKGMVTHSSILAWRISWTEEPVHGVTKSQTRLSDQRYF